MSTKKIVITGGPGTGKTSLINELIRRKHTCFEEVSRQVILDAKKEGIDQLFLHKPLLFSELLLKGRMQQFECSGKSNAEVVFFDRGIPDVLAYMGFIGAQYPDNFAAKAKSYVYDTVFILPPWKAIYKSDNERYESFSQAEEIHQYLLDTYSKYSYSPIDVPFGTVRERTDFILKALHLK